MVSSSGHNYGVVSSSPPPRRVIKLNGKRSGEESMKKLKKPMVHVEQAVVAVAEDDEKLGVVNALKSGPFQRSIFSEDDEILLLQGIIEHKKAGNDPSTFYDFVKSDLQNQVTLKQVYRKRKGLKEKFFKKINKQGKEDVSFDNAHEKLIFDLSKKIWSFQQYAGAAEPKKHRPSSSSSTAAPLLLCFTELLRTKDVRFNEELIRQGMELLSKKVTLKLERKWKSLVEAEAELFHQRVLLFAETAKLTLEAYKASGN